MAVGAYTGPNSSTGTGAVTVFAYQFRILASGDLDVYLDDVLQSSGYTVSGVGDAGGGNVTFSVAPASGVVVRLERSASYDRSTDYQRNGSFDEETVDADFDRAVMLIQQIKALSDRSPKITSGSALAGDSFTFPAPGAGQFLRWNSLGTALETADAVAETGTYLLTATGQSRTVVNKLAETISVLDFLTDAEKADVVARTQLLNVAVGVQAAIDYAHLNGGNLFFPAGTYKISSALTIYSYMTLYGVGSHEGSIINGTHAGDLFTSAVTLEHCEIFGLAFDGAGCTAIHGTTASYMNSNHIHNCHFYATLLRCISGNLILNDIGPQNTFGYFGTAGANHSWILAQGDAVTTGNTTNINRIFGNRFRNAKGSGVGVYFDQGFQVEIFHNNFEGSSVNPISLLGMAITRVWANWFENINFTHYIEYGNATAGGGNNLINVVDGNYFNAHASVTSLISYSGAGSVSFSNNYGVGMTGKTITNSSDGFVGRAWNNSLSGSSSVDNYATFTTATVNGLKFPATAVASADANTLDDYEEGTWTPTDVSGAGLTFTTAVGRYTKIGRLVRVSFRVTFPATADGTSAAIGSLPFTVANADAENIGGLVTSNVGLLFSEAVQNTTKFNLYNTSSTIRTNADLTGATVRGVIVYEI